MDNHIACQMRESIINLGVLAHVDAGKTTLTEGFLVHSGVKRTMGRVDAGTTTTDALPLEKQRGITIKASTVSFYWKGAKINLIDTPGHMDFIAEVGRSLAVLDGVILVISAKEGIQPQTRVIFSKLIETRIPTLLFINKIDRAGVSMDVVFADIRKKLTHSIIPMQRAHNAGQLGASVEPLDHTSGPLHEAIISESDSLLGDYMAGKPVSGEACMRALRAGVRRCELFPAYLGAALHDLGIRPLLDAVPLFFHGGGDRDDPLSAMAYKVERDESGRKRLYLRVFSGEIVTRGWADLPSGESMQIKNLLAARDGRFIPAERIIAGDVGVLMDAPLLNCGDFLGRRTPLKLNEMPAPLLIAAVSPASPANRPALIDALQQLTEEDPSLAMRLDTRTGEIMLRLYGSLQREIIRAMLSERFGLDAVFSPLATLFKAQPLASADARIGMGAPGNFHSAGIALRIEPLPGGSGNQYSTAVSYGDLTKSFQNGVEEGVNAGLAEGLGEEIVDTRVTFTGMDFSSVTSTPADFRRLAPEVLRRAFETAGLRRMEPWLYFTVACPAVYQKKALMAIGKLRASLDDVQYTQDECIAQGEVPLDAVKDFAADLAALTQGKGIFTTRFLEYRDVKSRN